MRVLVVDDEPDIHQLLAVKLRLSGRGEVVGTATAMPEGVELARKIQPDVVVTDLVMSPSRDDDTYLAKLRSVAPSAYVVVFTGYVRKAGEPMPSGADAYVVKGGTLDPLLDVIDGSTRPRTAASTPERSPLPGSAQVTLSAAAEQLTVSVAGDLDVSTVNDVLAGVLPAIEGGSRVVHLDLSGVDFIDACGLRVLVDANEHAGRAGVTFALARPSPTARRLLQVAGLHDAFDIDE